MFSLPLRMPFGPAPAAAHRQNYVAKEFGGLWTPKTKMPCCTTLMDDLACCSETLEEHIADMDHLCARAESRGFEFKLSKGQFSEEELELWGGVCGEFGRRATPKKIEQFENWQLEASLVF